MNVLSSVDLSGLEPDWTSLNLDSIILDNLLFNIIVNILCYVVCFLLGDSLVSEFYKPTFRNTLSVPSS
jgi:hypothetical protein